MLKVRVVFKMSKGEYGKWKISGGVYGWYTRLVIMFKILVGLE